MSELEKQQICWLEAHQHCARYDTEEKIIRQILRGPLQIRKREPTYISERKQKFITQFDHKKIILQNSRRKKKMIGYAQMNKQKEKISRSQYINQQCKIKEELQKIKAQQKRKRAKQFIQLLNQKKVARQQENLISEKKIKAIKTTQKLYHKLEKQFTSNYIISELQQQKKKMKEIRNFFKPINYQQLKEHQRKVNQSNKNRLIKYIQNLSDRKYQTPKINIKMKKILEQQQKQTKEQHQKKIQQKKQKKFRVQNYIKYIEKKFKKKKKKVISQQKVKKNKSQKINDRNKINYLVKRKNQFYQNLKDKRIQRAVKEGNYEYLIKQANKLDRMVDSIDNPQFSDMMKSLKYKIRALQIMS